MRVVIDLTGMVFNKLTVIKQASFNRSGNATWLCACSCGNEKVLSQDHLCRKKDAVKSCGCSITRKGPSNPQWKGVGEISGNWWCNHVLRERSQTKRHKITISITMDYAWELFLTQERRCALSGLPIIISSSPGVGTASIDHINSSLGYEKDNIQWVHKHINFMKRTYTNEYFITMCRRVAANNEL